MLVRLSQVTSDELENMLRLAWGRRAPRQLVAAHPGKGSPWP